MILPEFDQQQWLQLELRLTERFGRQPVLDEILIFIGSLEAGLPPKKLTETDKENLKQVAISAILAPAKYYELMWVDDTGWPHFRQLDRLPQMTEAAYHDFLKKYILQYVQKNKLS
ncbi:MAG: hypothetical protein WAT19_09255 [Ferruginibacter sp.]